METKDVLCKLRRARNMTQGELAEKLFVTRQAVSRWENGETIPGPDTLKALSRLFDVSVNTLLGAPRKLFCQCCGMPLEDGLFSRETDGSINEDYCRWCYADGKFAYNTQEELLDFLERHMAAPGQPPEQVRAFYAQFLPLLKRWGGDGGLQK